MRLLRLTESGRGSERQISVWVSRPTKTERPTAKKLGIFTTISHGLQEKAPKLNLIQYITNP